MNAISGVIAVLHIVPLINMLINGTIYIYIRVYLLLSDPPTKYLPFQLNYTYTAKTAMLK